MNIHQSLEVFLYHNVSPETCETMTQLRGKTVELAQLIFDTVPDSDERDEAIKRLGECQMWCNRALACFSVDSVVDYSCVQEREPKPAVDPNYHPLNPDPIEEAPEVEPPLIDPNVVNVDPNERVISFPDLQTTSLRPDELLHNLLASMDNLPQDPAPIPVEAAPSEIPIPLFTQNPELVKLSPNELDGNTDILPDHLTEVAPTYQIP